MKRYRMVLKPITAVHIGSGNSITPLEYTTRENTIHQEIFVRFHPELVVQSLNQEQKKEFERLVDRKDHIKLREFLGKHVGANSLWYTSAVTPRFSTEYRKRKNDEKNSLEIEEDYRAPNQRGPVIPGSSIKGAIRTAVLNYRVLAKDTQGKQYHEQGYSHGDTNFQNWYLDRTRPNDDPFRSLMIGDCTFEPRTSQLVGSLHQYTPSSRNGELFNSIAIYAEMITGVLTGQETNAETDLILEEYLDGIRVPRSKTLSEKQGRRLYEKPLHIDEILAAVDDFYNRAFDDEYDNFYKKSRDDAVFSSGKRIAEHVNTLKAKGEHLIRIGRWSHVESVTVEPPYRKPVGRRGYGRTRTFLDYNGAWFSMGWCSFALEKD